MTQREYNCIQSHWVQLWNKKVLHLESLNQAFMMWIQKGLALHFEELYRKQVR
jgi:hypothetical protein